MSRAGPLRLGIGFVLLSTAALLSAQCGGNDVIDSEDATTDAAFEGSPGDAFPDTGLGDGPSETSAETSSMTDGQSDAAGASPDAADAADAVSSTRDALPDASDAEGRVEGGTADGSIDGGAADADADADVDVASADASSADADASLVDADAQGFTLLPPSLGTARTFALLAGSTITNTGTGTAIVGDVGIWPGTAEVGLTPGQVTGTFYLGDAVAMKAEQDLTTAYNDLAGRPCQHPMSNVDLGGKTLPPGVYCFGAAAAQLVGDLTLDAQGDPDAVWIFQIGTALTIAQDVSTTMINSGNACNVYWQVGSAATINLGAQFKGTILAQQLISLFTGASISPGRALTQIAAVTLQSNAISNAGCP